MKGFGFAKGDVSADETEPEDVQSMLHKVRIGDRNTSKELMRI
jgi:hypothetical protein